MTRTGHEAAGLRLAIMECGGLADLVRFNTRKLDHSGPLLGFGGDELPISTDSSS